ncbi:bifunctional folylpolyglutamate synthase/dihydrofolate synthase [Heliophilum fasciatum]|uniref:tetrahydrofolate synthase n=1 Tax=Heliophilum fasciatum TaxID=35700 RepID=A0A4V2SY08_9FIRM|nr:folylpolyglutamate synthase/dihydrofolate synthase family protein [Heliophilum fasciatum]MCW2277147.1 dihydrofolate synthase/folylpolyglutamate synthase [Heliophilum fasciatum]TCP68216.1 dihydrofolate synthase/folylpolyglutamate synthase [Heliophilum fasciatum]
MSTGKHDDAGEQERHTPAATTRFASALHYLQELTKFGFNLGLQRITELLRRLGDPHRAEQGAPAFMHIGGTNGKGSTAVMTAAVLQAAGYRTGLFTSPHLHCYTERTRIDGRPIAPDDMADLIEEMGPHIEAMVADGFEHPTEFEVWTALSLLYFQRCHVDIAVIEVGLGGAIDSTNVIRPIVAAITNVSMDHMEYLGHDVEAITKVKAGIIKEQVPIVTATKDPQVLAVIRQKAQSQGAPLIHVQEKAPEKGNPLNSTDGDDVEPSCMMSDVSWSVATTEAAILVRGRLHTYKPIVPPLSGAHQRDNVATAIALLEVAAEQGFTWTPSHLEQGLAVAKWPGRQERIGRFFIDGAHNVAGAETLAATLQRPPYRDRRKIFVLGMLSDKERSAVAAILAPLAEQVIVTRPNSPRAGNWTTLAAAVSLYCSQVHVEAAIDQAIAQADQAARAVDGIVVVTGSLYMIAEARHVILHRQTTPEFTFC